MKKTLAKIIVLGLAGFGIIFGAYNAINPEKKRGPSRIEQIIKQNQGEEEGYDNSTVAVSDKAIEAMLNMTYKVEVSATYKDRFSNFRENVSYVGSCFLAKSRNGRQYFVTCEHVVNPDKIRSDGWDVFDFEKVDDVQIRDENNNTYDVEVIKTNTAADIAILVAKDDLDLEKLIDFADLELKIGDAIYAVGNPLNRGEFLSQGIITNLGENSFFYESAALNPGNSGGPLYVLKDGVPYIAGIGRFVVINNPTPYDPDAPPAQGMFGVVHYFYIQDELEQAVEDYEDLQEKLKKEAQEQEENDGLDKPR